MKCIQTCFQIESSGFDESGGSSSVRKLTVQTSGFVIRLRNTSMICVQQSYKSDNMY